MTEQEGQRPNKPSRVRQAAHHTSHASSHSQSSSRARQAQQERPFARKKTAPGSHAGASPRKKFAPAHKSAHKNAVSDHSSAAFPRKKAHVDNAKLSSSEPVASAHKKAASVRANAASGEKRQPGYRSRTMKSVRAREIKRITSDTAPAYNGELDPKAGKRSAIAPGNITREKNRRERLVA